MLKQSTVNFHPFQLGEEALNASRQFWLAGLGAAALTSDWVQTEATRSLKAFKSLVKEGTVVESRAVSFVGDRIELSMNRANRIWSRTRHTVESTVRQAADTAVTIANSALPKSLPRIELPLGAKPKAKPSVAKASRARKAARKGPAKTARKAKRAARTAAAK